eukprot:CAMPEP_0170193604 /NCGR_PEP_ID=MMETSP0040_2-20121228/57255_1 /TAXON_ID=641309 /ORGANISM="Lotharella oceanica, Strain CCMP622" /LENGTH=298 /DNA_ID=CAMNT_0010442291 /DNA_START=47 /DNA_END=940 /DNA_ORIENTATION=+
MTRSERIKCLSSHYFLNATHAQEAEKDGPNPSKEDVERCKKTDSKIRMALADLNAAVERCKRAEDYYYYQKEHSDDYEDDNEERRPRPKLTTARQIVWDLANEAFGYLNTSVSLYKKVFHDDSPYLFHQMLMLGKISFHLGRVDSVRCLSSAVEGLIKSHGTNHPLVKQADTLLMQAKRDLPIGNAAVPSPPITKSRRRTKPYLVKTKRSNKTLLNRDSMPPPSLEEVNKEMERLHIGEPKSDDSEDRRENHMHFGNSIEKQYRKWDRIPSYSVDESIQSDQDALQAAESAGPAIATW